MPKMKTNKSARKRFKVTGTGKIVRRKQNKRHILTKKSSKSKRHMCKADLVAKADMPRLRKLLGV